MRILLMILPQCLHPFKYLDPLPPRLPQHILPVRPTTPGRRIRKEETPPTAHRKVHRQSLSRPSLIHQKLRNLTLEVPVDDVCVKARRGSVSDSRGRYETGGETLTFRGFEEGATGGFGGGDADAAVVGFEGAGEGGGAGGGICSVEERQEMEDRREREGSVPVMRELEDRVCSSQYRQFLTPLLQEKSVKRTLEVPTSNSSSGSLPPPSIPSSGNPSPKLPQSVDSFNKLLVNPDAALFVVARYCT